MRPPYPPARHRRRGFTLAEVLISLGISGFVVAGGLWLILTGIKTSTRATNASITDLTQWGIASRLWIDSRVANGISIYANDEPASMERWLRKVVDQRGNLIVFSLSQTDNSNLTAYTKLSGYCYNPTDDVIYRFDYDVPAADQAAHKSLEAILIDRRDAIRASYQSIASNITLTNNTGLFICRSGGTAARLSCIVTAGDNTDYQHEKTIEATFYVRS